MTDENFEEQDTSLEPAGGEEPQETSQPSVSAEDQIAQLKKTNQGLYERLKKAEAAAKNKGETSVQPETSIKPKADPLGEAKDYARLIAKGYTDEELSFLEKYKGDKSIVEVAKDLDDSVKAMRDRKRTEQETPAPSAQTGKAPEPVDLGTASPSVRADAFWGKVNKAKTKSFE